jgi:hypothetical protein
LPTQLGAHGIVTLNIVKQEEYVASLDHIDGSDKFDIIVSKWKNISTIVMNKRCVEHHQNNLTTCKDLNGVPNHICDYHNKKGTNDNY